MAENPLTLAHTVVNALEERKGDDILLLDLVGVCSFTDYFVLCSGVSERTLRALVEEVRIQVKAAHDLLAQSVEGDAADGWILMDYGGVVIHLLSPSMRAYYRLEELWSEGKILLRMH
jgi:ribosome-associated protein